MGGGKWDTGIYGSARASRRSSGIDDFDYTVKVRSGKASKVNEVLDAKKMVNPDSSRYPFPLRESRDSEEHPLSVPVAIFFDVTGSMGQIPRVLQEKLPKLMDVIIDKAGLSDPQVLVGAVGDATCDRYPFQVGQFESDNKSSSKVVVVGKRLNRMHLHTTLPHTTRQQMPMRRGARKGTFLPWVMRHHGRR